MTGVHTHVHGHTLLQCPRQEDHHSKSQESALTGMKFGTAIFSILFSLLSHIILFFSYISHIFMLFSQVSCIVFIALYPLFYSSFTSHTLLCCSHKSHSLFLLLAHCSIVSMIQLFFYQKSHAFFQLLYCF